MKTRILASEIGETPFQRLMGHNRTVLQGWSALEESFYQHTELGESLLEQVRRVLAQGNKCAYCMAKGKPRQESLNKRESLATAFAELFLLDHLSIGNGHFEVLREAFTEKEILELCAFICFTTGAQRLGAILNLRPEEQGQEAWGRI